MASEMIQSISTTSIERQYILVTIVWKNINFQGRDISVESLASSLSEYRQEATTATQTDFSLAGHHPPPPPALHSADPTQRPHHHPFSLTTPASTQHSQPHNFISCSLFPTSSGAQWQQGPLSAPLPSPNDPPSSNGEPGVEGIGPSLLPSAPFPAPQKPDAASSWSGERWGYFDLGNWISTYTV